MEAPAARTLGPGEGLARGGQGVWVYTLENFHPWRPVLLSQKYWAMSSR